MGVVIEVRQGKELRREKNKEIRTRWLFGLPRHPRRHRCHRRHYCHYSRLRRRRRPRSHSPSCRSCFLGLLPRQFRRSHSHRCFRFRPRRSSPQSGSRFVAGWIQEEAGVGEQLHGSVNVGEGQPRCHPFPAVVRTFF